VLKWVKHYAEHKNVDDKPRSGRRKRLNTSQKQSFAEEVLKQQSVPAAVKAVQFEGQLGTTFSVSTAYRAAREALDLKTPNPQPIASAATKAKRLQFSCARHRVGNMMAVDSTYFTLHGSQPRRRRWVRKGEKPTRPKPLKSQQLHVYAGISKHGKTSLIFATGTTGLKKRYFKPTKPGSTARRQAYSGVCAREFQDIMLEQLWPQGKAIMQAARQPDPTFLIDGASPHTAESTKQLLQSLGIATVAAWPPNSPDLNPIENLWAWMKNRVYAQQYSSLDALKAAVLEAWDAVPASMLKNLMRSFNKRKQICAARGGDYTGH
jgi:transposase